MSESAQGRRCICKTALGRTGTQNTRKAQSAPLPALETVSGNFGDPVYSVPVGKREAP